MRLLMSHPSLSSFPKPPSKSAHRRTMSKPVPPFPGLPGSGPQGNGHQGDRVVQDLSPMDSGVARPRVTVPSSERTPNTSPNQSPGGANTGRLSSIGSCMSADTTPISPLRTPLSPESLNKALPPAPGSTQCEWMHMASPATASPNEPTHDDLETIVRGYERSYTPPPNARRSAAGIPGTMASRQSRHSSPYRSQRRATGARPKSSPTLRPRRIGQRIGRRVKSIFSKNEVDPDAYEYIEDRHWTD